MLTARLGGPGGGAERAIMVQHARTRGTVGLGVVGVRTCVHACIARSRRWERGRSVSVCLRRGRLHRRMGR